MSEGGVGTSFGGVMGQVKEVGSFLERGHLMESNVRIYNVQARDIKKKKKERTLNNVLSKYYVLT